MADRYYNVLEFSGLVVGAPVSLPHDLNFSGLALAPHVVIPMKGGFSVTADDTVVTVQRLPGGSEEVDVFVELLHTILQAFGGEADLPVRPFVLDLNLPGNVFGDSYQVVSNPNRLTTTTTMFQNHVQLVTPALSGTYRVAGYAFVDSAAKMQARLQNVTDGAQVGLTAQITINTNMDRRPVVFAGDIVFAAASKTFAMQFRDDPPPGNAAGMSASRIELWRVS